MKYTSQSSFTHEEQAKVGILLANLGTPDAPTAGALRSYLAEFLSDTRVIEKPRWQWWPILHGIVLRVRPKKSAALYQSIWTDGGSPLLVTAKKQREKLEKLLLEEIGTPLAVELGMCYGNPSMKEGLEKLREKGAKRIVVFPLYPQYSATSTGAVMDAVFDVLKTWRWIPEIRTLGSYHDEPGYIEALANSVRKLWDSKGKPEKLVLSYHGIPKSYFEGGDPYHCQCHKTTRLLAENLGLKKDEYQTTFQSIFGKDEWIGPATDKTLENLAKSGLKKLDVICPGFSADCLETLEEIEGENKEIFLENGGEQFRYIPALNDSDDFIYLMAEVLRKNLYSWVQAKDVYSEEEAASRANLTDKLYKEMSS